MNTEPTFVKEDRSPTNKPLEAICLGALTFASLTGQALPGQEPLPMDEDKQVETISHQPPNYSDAIADAASVNHGRKTYLPLSTAEARKRAMEHYAPLAESLYKEYGELVDKKFMEGLSPREEKRFDYVQYQLSMYEDAENGDHIDAFAAKVDSFVQYAAEIRQMKEELLDALPKRKKASRKRK